MKKLTIVAALLMVTTSAHAGTVSFEIEGKRINIEMPSNCTSVSCLKITAPGVSGFNSKRSDDDGDNSPAPERPDFKGPNSGRFNNDDRASGPGRPGFNGGRRFNDDDRASEPGRPGFDGGRRFNDDDRTSGPGRPGFDGGRRFNNDDRASGPGRPDFNGGRRFNNDDRASGPGRPDFNGGRRFNDEDANPSDGPGRPGFKSRYKSKRYNDDDNNASKPDRDPAPAPVPAAPAPATTTDNAPAAPAPTDVAPPAPAPAQVAAATPERQPAPVAAAPESDPNSPVGVWATEENKGNVRIEQCGDNLCGYSEKTGEKVLINMKPQGSKWAGRINDPDSGRKYDSTIVLKGTNSLRVQGCAFGGMFCGGQTWKRVS